MHTKQALSQTESQCNVSQRTDDGTWSSARKPHVVPVLAVLTFDPIRGQALTQPSYSFIQADRPAHIPFQSKFLNTFDSLTN